MWKQIATALGLGTKETPNMPTVLPTPQRSDTLDESSSIGGVQAPVGQHGGPGAGRPAEPAASTGAAIPGKPILNLIGTSEGTDRGDGYNESLAYGQYVDGVKTKKGSRNHVPLVTMTLDQIDALQTKRLADPDNTMNSSALGRYQIVRKTLRALRATLPTKGTDLFDEDMQDYLGQALLDDRGFRRWRTGSMSDDAFINSLSKEWASLPCTSGKGYYNGQNAGVTVAQVRTALAKCK